MKKKVRIFTTTVLGGDYGNIETDFQSRVNEYLAEHPGATVEWLQSSSRSFAHDTRMYLTAIVTYSEGESGGRPAPTDPPSGGTPYSIG